MVEYLMSIVFPSVDVDRAIENCKLLYDKAYYPDRIEILIKFDEEKYTEEEIDKKIKEGIPEHSHKIRFIVTPRDFGWASTADFNEELFRYSKGKILWSTNDNVEDISDHYDYWFEPYEDKLCMFRVGYDAGYRWGRRDELCFDLPWFTRKFFEVRGVLVYGQAPVAEFKILEKHLPEIVVDLDYVVMTHSPQHIGQDQHTRDKSPLSGGFAVSIPDREYRSNKKIIHKGKKLYPHEIYTEIDVPRIKKFLELNPEYKV